MRSFILMIQFMSRYPIPLQIEFSAEHFVRGMKWMPLVGLCIALPAAACFHWLTPLLGQRLSAFIAISALILITGALHLDGLADTADGLFCYRSRARMLEIMRDSTLGANGVTAIVLAILCKHLLLSEMNSSAATAAILSAVVGGRMALTWHSAAASYARQEPGLGEYVNKCGYRQALAATFFSLALLIPIYLIWETRLAHAVGFILFAHLAAILLAIGFASYLTKKIGGITGDTIGATIELSEIIILFLFFISWK